LTVVSLADPATYADGAPHELFAALSTAEQRQLIKLLDRVRADVDLPA